VALAVVTAGATTTRPAVAEPRRCLLALRSSHHGRPGAGWIFLRTDPLPDLPAGSPPTSASRLTQRPRTWGPFLHRGVSSPFPTRLPVRLPPRASPRTGSAPRAAPARRTALPPTAARSGPATARAPARRPTPRLVVPSSLAPGARREARGRSRRPPEIARPRALGLRALAAHPRHLRRSDLLPLEPPGTLASVRP
jgi:hypothetical protein